MQQPVPQIVRIRILLHAAFGRLWKPRSPGSRPTARQKRACLKTIKTTRGAAYEWLAAQMGMTRQACHFGRMNHEQLSRAWDIIWAFRHQHGKGAADAIRQWQEDQNDANHTRESRRDPTG